MALSSKHTDAPASGIKILSSGSDCQRESFNLGRQGGDARERDIVKSVIDFIRENHNTVLDTEVADSLELIFGKDLSDGVVYNTAVSSHLSPAG